MITKAKSDDLKRFEHGGVRIKYPDGDIFEATFSDQNQQSVEYKHNGKKVLKSKFDREKGKRDKPKNV